MMEFKKCEHCGEQIHIRSKKCPFCNQTVEETPAEIIEEDEEENVENKPEDTALENEEVKNEEMVNDSKEDDFEDENHGKVVSEPNSFDFRVGEEPQDYVYKAEVKHSVEYTHSVSNLTKVFLSALCTLPLIGQILGTFLGVFFITYEDSDRKSFGKALIILSVLMFLLYALYVKQAMSILNSADFNALYNSLGK